MPRKKQIDSTMLALQVLNNHSPETATCEDFILAALSDWDSWVKAGAHPHVYFERNRALCSTFNRLDYDGWMGEFKSSYPTVLDIHAFDRNSYPFGGESVYVSEVQNNLVHENPMRLDWVHSAIDYLYRGGKLEGMHGRVKLSLSDWRGGNVRKAL